MQRPDLWPPWPCLVTHLEGLSDSNEDAVGVAVIAQDEVSVALGQRLLTESHLVGPGYKPRLGSEQ